MPSVCVVVVCQGGQADSVEQRVVKQGDTTTFECSSQQKYVIMTMIIIIVMIKMIIMNNDSISFHNYDQSYDMIHTISIIVKKMFIMIIVLMIILGGSSAFGVVQKGARYVP